LSTSDENLELRGEQIVSLYYVGTSLDSAELKAVEAEVNKAFNVLLDPHPFESTRFKELRDEGRVPPSILEATEIAASRTLSDWPTRALAIAIKSSGGLLVRDLSNQLPSEARGRTQEIQNALRNHRLIDAEIVVICTKAQTQIARVPSREVLARMSEEGVRCACGRAIAEERTEEALTITDLGRDILDGSRWLTLLLLVSDSKYNLNVLHLAQSTHE
jgi:hypothetical protein